MIQNLHLWGWIDCSMNQSKASVSNSALLPCSYCISSDFRFDFPCLLQWRLSIIQVILGAFQQYLLLPPAQTKHRTSHLVGWQRNPASCHRPCWGHETLHAGAPNFLKTKNSRNNRRRRLELLWGWSVVGVTLDSNVVKVVLEFTSNIRFLIQWNQLY